MLMQRENILSPKVLESFDAICFTSNGVLKKNGELVMGAGIAKSFKKMWPPVAKRAGHCVRMGGNRVHMLKEVFIKEDVYISLVSFPTKHHWRDDSDVDLIKTSAEQLVKLANAYRWKKISLTKPGCGNGGLKWDDVRKVIEPILDDRFTIFYQ